nr:RNA-directed DNA polymerase, eukaryota [Tanacetum cinerariifolium]
MTNSDIEDIGVVKTQSAAFSPLVGSMDPGMVDPCTFMIDPSGAISVGPSGIQETKLEAIDSFLDHPIWPYSNVEFGYRGSLGSSGGILTLWYKNVFTMKQHVVDPNFLGIIGSWVGKFGGESGLYSDHKEAAAFNDLISRVDLFYFSFSSQKYTRFDKVFVLCRTFSDHCPIMLSSGIPNFGPKLFKVFDRKLSVEDVVGLESSFSVEN